MGLLRVSVNDEAVYSGTTNAVPRVGDDVRYNGEVERVTAVVWDFGSDGDVSVELLTGDRPYTF